MKAYSAAPIKTASARTLLCEVTTYCFNGVMRTLSKNFLRKITVARAAVSVIKFHSPKLPEPPPPHFSTQNARPPPPPPPPFPLRTAKTHYECNRVKTVGGIANSSDPLIWVSWPKLFSAIGLKLLVELQIV